MILFDHQLMERKQSRVDIEDRGYQFGDGVYEVLRVYNGQIFCLSEHLKRFETSAKAIRIQLPYSLDRLKSLLLKLVRTNSLQEGTLYLQVSRGQAPRSHPFPSNARPVIVAYTSELPRPAKFLEQGIRAITTEDIRWLRCDIKTLNLLGAVLAKQDAVEQGCQEALMHRKGTVTEGSATNIFIVQNGTLLTHPANHLILHGITRALTIELAAEHGIPIKEESFTLQQLQEADEVLITGTTMEICPVVEVDGRSVGNGTPGSVVRKLQAAFENRIAHTV